TNCGPGPYGKLTGNVLIAQAAGAPSKPKEDVAISFDLCPEKSFKTNAEGKAIVNVTKNTNVIIRLEADDIVPTQLAAFRMDRDEFEGTAHVAPKIFRSVIAPDFSADKTLIAFGITFPTGTFDGGVPDGGPTEPCQRSEGVTFQVPGHPEAKVTY